MQKSSQQISDLQSSLTETNQKVEDFSINVQKSSQQISDLQEQLQSSLPEINQKSKDLSSSFSNKFSRKQSSEQTELTQNFTVEELIRQFNNQNREYFHNDSFQPLDLTSDSREGKLQMNGIRIMQLEVSENVHRGSYLKVKINGEYWLILNILSQGYNRVKKDIPQNPEVFKIISSSGTFELIKPAKLRKVNSTLWEIEEAGELRL